MDKLELDSPIVLHGVSGAGKTEFAVAHFHKAHIVRRRDDLKNISFTCDGLVFDDMDFTKWEPETSGGPGQIRVAQQTLGVGLACSSSGWVVSSRLLVLQVLLVQAISEVVMVRRDSHSKPSRPPRGQKAARDPRGPCARQTQGRAPRGSTSLAMRARKNPARSKQPLRAQTTGHTRTHGHCLPERSMHGQAAQPPHRAPHTRPSTPQNA